MERPDQSAVAVVGLFLGQFTFVVASELPSTVVAGGPHLRLRPLATCRHDLLLVPIILEEWSDVVLVCQFAGPVDGFHNLNFSLAGRDSITQLTKGDLLLAQR